MIGQLGPCFVTQVKFAGCLERVASKFQLTPMNTLQGCCANCKQQCDEPASMITKPQAEKLLNFMLGCSTDVFPTATLDDLEVSSCLMVLRFVGLWELLSSNLCSDQSQDEHVHSTWCCRNTRPSL